MLQDIQRNSLDEEHKLSRQVQVAATRTSSPRIVTERYRGNAQIVMYVNDFLHYKLVLLESASGYGIKFNGLSKHNNH